MKIDYLSDLHLDFYFPPDNVTSEAVISIFDPIFLNNRATTPGDILIIAGDIGHYNDQNIQVLKIFQQRYYKYIICVLGNHDYYLINRIQEDEYDLDSFKRADEMKELINSCENMFCLDGNVIEIKGIRIGGTMGWYDSTYANHYYLLYKDQKLNDDWNAYNNDSQMIKSDLIKRYDDMFRIELPKIVAVYQKCDVMVTHINPSHLHEHISPQYHNSPSNSFFTFGGHKFLQEGTMKHWVFGHTHSETEYELFGVQVHCNPFGYPSESYHGEWVWIRSFEV